MSSFVVGRSPSPTALRARPGWTTGFPARSTAMAALCTLLPIWYLLGVLAMLWCLPVLVLGSWLLANRPVVLPRGIGLLVALLALVAVSGLQLRSIGSLALFGYRLALFASLATVYVWIVTVPDTVLPSRRIAGWWATAWVWLVAFGYGALVFQGASTPSPFQLVLPNALAAEEYLRDLTVVRLAEVQSWLGFPLPRPAAPFAYANGWGSALGLLTPWFVHCWIVDATPQRRRIGVALALAALVPIVVSMNRGLWLSLGVVAVVYAVRSALDGDRRALAGIGLLAAAVGVVVVATPLGSLITAKFDNAADSNAARTSVYQSALGSALDSPLVGFGSPRRASEDLPLVGTQGMLWYLLQSHGVVAAGLFVGWLVGVVRRAARLATPIGVAAFASVLVALVQVPFYGLLPQLPVVGVAAGICWRERLRTAGAGR
ncbi:MAG: O-antigen ligase family protein [Acidimicrobiales bacterium]